MDKKIEQLLRLVADIERFSEDAHEDTGKHTSTELIYEELTWVAAASAQPNKSPKKG